MTSVIVVGYPKSGSTWLSRLVAELVVCPVVGFWNEPNNNEIAREGQYRKSDFQLFKSHHQLHEICSNYALCEEKIIYVIRDPRDITVSGAHFFRINSEKMMNTVLYGSGDVHHWVRVPWKTHYKPYLEHDCLFVKCESLLAFPEYEAKRILDYLGLCREDTQILEAIERQSFKKKKELFLRNNKIHKANFMRSGKSGQWRKILSEKQKELFLEVLSDDLVQFAYESRMN